MLLAPARSCTRHYSRRDHGRARRPPTGQQGFEDWPAPARRQGGPRLDRLRGPFPDHRSRAPPTLPPARHSAPASAHQPRSQPMYSSRQGPAAAQLDEIRAAGLHKPERVIGTPQPTASGRRDRRVRRRGAELLRQQLPGPGRPPRGRRRGEGRAGQRGFGMACVRFICGTQDLHLELEAALSRRSSARRTRSSTPPASTPTAACSRPSSARRTRSSPTP